jgi:hypothetical protein
MPKTETNDYSTGVTQQQIEALARCLLPEIKKFFDREEGQLEFEKWKKQQSSKDKANTAKT